MGRGGGGGGGFSGGGGGRGGSFGGSSRSYSGGRSYSGSHHSSGGYRPSSSYRPSGGYYHHSGSSGNSWLLPYMVGRMSSNNGGGGGNYNNYNNNNNGNRNNGGGGNSGCFGSGSGCLKVFLIVMIVVFAMALLGFLVSNDEQTVQRTPLTGTSGVSGKITDPIGILDEDKLTLSNALNYFRDETGVVADVYVCAYDDITTLDETADLYGSLFGSDERHLLLVYRANIYTDDDDGYFFFVGEAAETVMDDSAQDVFENKLVYYYNDLDLSYSEFLAKAFRTTADTIMEAPEDSVGAAIFVGVLLLMSCLGLFLLVRKEKQIEKAAKDAEILNTPLENLADKEVEDLKKKYSSEQYSSYGSGQGKNSSTVSDLKDQYDK
ncbi:MAG: hypothetical protein IKR08_04495 [Firmicutes bacterium]|nr:hypothetical protein [Bacillota bacterium]